MNANETANKETMEEVEALLDVMDERKAMVINKTFLFNHHLLHPRMINIFKEMLQVEKDNDLNAIVISELGPKKKYAEYLPEMKMAIISLPKLLDGSIETIESEEGKLGIAAGIWINMIFSFCHELYHNMSLSNVQDLDLIDKDREEEMANKYGNDMLSEIQRVMDAEPPTLAEFPWFNTRIMEHMVNKIQEGNQMWLGQKEMSDAGVIFKSNDNEFTSLREYFKATSADPIWESESAPLELKTDVELPEEAMKTTGEENMDESNFKAGPKDRFAENFPVLAAQADEAYETSPGPEPVAPAMQDDNLAEDMELLDMQNKLFENAPTDEEMANAFAKNGISTKTPADVAYESIEKDIQSGYKGVPGTSPEAKAHYEAHTEVKPGLDPNATDLGLRQTKAVPELHKYCANGEHIVEKNPQMPTPVDRTVDGQPVYGSREDMQKAVLLNPEAHKEPTVQKACQGLWRAMYNQMFANCRRENGRFVDVVNDISMNPINVVNSSVLKKAVESYVTMTTDGQMATVKPCNSEWFIRARAFANNTIPGFEVTLNMGNKKRKFHLVAQNPARTSPYAARARKGENIAWLIECETNEYCALIDNGVYHKKVNGKWTPVGL